MDFPINFQILNITSPKNLYYISFILNFLLKLIRALVLGWVGSRVFKTDLASIFHFEQSNGALLCVSLEPFFIVKKIEN